MSFSELSNPGEFHRPSGSPPRGPECAVGVEAAPGSKARSMDSTRERSMQHDRLKSHGLHQRFLEHRSVRMQMAPSAMAPACPPSSQALSFPWSLLLTGYRVPFIRRAPRCPQIGGLVRAVVLELPVGRPRCLWWIQAHRSPWCRALDIPPRMSACPLNALRVPIRAALR